MFRPNKMVGRTLLGWQNDGKMQLTKILPKYSCEFTTRLMEQLSCHRRHLPGSCRGSLCLRLCHVPHQRRKKLRRRAC